MPIPLWLPVFTLLANLFFLLLSMRNFFPRVVLPVLPILLLFPWAEGILRHPMEMIMSPWASVAMVSAAALAGLWVFRLPPPRWAQQ